MIKQRTLEDIRARFNVSSATVRNWIKTGLIKSPGNGEKYTEEEFAGIVYLVESVSGKLRKRANRSMSEGKAVCYSGTRDEAGKKALSDALEIHRKESLEPEQSLLLVSHAMLMQAGLIDRESMGRAETSLDCFLLKWGEQTGTDILNRENPYSCIKIPPAEDDFTGAFYQSLLSISSRSKMGLYYTPVKLLREIEVSKSEIVYDPCCGSGGILLGTLPAEHDPEKVYASDIDTCALNICRVNLAAYFRDRHMRSSVFFHNILEREKSGPEAAPGILYDLVITNPPWGSRAESALVSMYPEISTKEPFSVSLFNCLEMLTPQGRLVFFLPYSFMNVEAHRKIRKHLADRGNFFEIRELGNSFPGVMSEAIRLDYHNSRNTGYFNITAVDGCTSEITFDDLERKSFAFPKAQSKTDREIISKVFSHKNIYLTGRCIFGMGIVTGDNKRHISRESTGSTVPIFRGRDIMPFRFSEPQCHIRPEAGSFQQSVPAGYFSMRKIAYRFICDRIVCALDKEGRVLLNSANFMIPDRSYQAESIVSLLNSSLYSFIYRKRHCSRKVLRSHLESIPFPVLNEDEHTIFRNLHDRIASGENAYGELDAAVNSVFNISPAEAEHVRKILAGNKNGS